MVVEPVRWILAVKHHRRQRRPIPVDNNHRFPWLSQPLMVVLLSQRRQPMRPLLQPRLLMLRLSKLLRLTPLR